jgi:hypothetical protein
VARQITVDSLGSPVVVLSLQLGALAEFREGGAEGVRHHTARGAILNIFGHLWMIYVGGSQVAVA